MSSAASVRSNRQLVIKLALVTLAMFGFGFAMVPIYNVLCEVSGLNGKTGVVNAAALDVRVDTSRTVSVEFVTILNEGMPWEFRPAVTRMDVHPGAINSTSFYARNMTKHDMVGQAIPSLTPGAAAKHFNKTECFCFTQQHFKSGQGIDMPVRFVIDRELPADIKTVTLQYTFFDITGQAAKTDALATN